MLHSAACERNRAPILAVLQRWLPAAARVLEVGSGSGQHAAHFCRHLPGLAWQPSERPEALADLQERLDLERRTPLAPAACLADAIALDVLDPGSWPRGPVDAVFSANTAHIMPEAAVAAFLAGSARVLCPGGRLFLYGPFRDHGQHSAESNAAFDAHLRSLDPAMGVRDTVQLDRWARAHGLEPLAVVAMPANNRILIWERRSSPAEAA